MRGRKIVVNGTEYRWRHGSDTTEVRRMDGSVLCRERNAVLIGVDQNSYERGVRKRTSDCTVTPRHIAYLIAKLPTGEPT
jgi:hypothetical protein